jgi:hypothetical protein
MSTLVKTLPRPPSRLVAIALIVALAVATLTAVLVATAGSGSGSASAPRHAAQAAPQTSSENGISQHSGSRP